MVANSKLCVAPISCK